MNPYEDLEKYLRGEEVDVDPSVQAARDLRDDKIADLSLIQGATQIGSALAGQQADTAPFESLKKFEQVKADEAMKDSLATRKAVADYMAQQAEAEKYQTDLGFKKTDQELKRQQLEESAKSRASRDENTAAYRSATLDLGKQTAMQGEERLQMQRDKLKAEAEAKAMQQEKAAEQQQVQSDIVTEAVDSALGVLDSSNFATGYAGTIGRDYLPSSSGNKLAKQLDIVKANLGFDKLQKMREASPTGGALGAVSERENTMLQSAMGNIDQFQDPKDLAKQLQKIRTLYKSINDRNAKYGKSQGAASAPSAPASGGKVRVISPDGKAGMIPAENLEKALQRGYSRG